METVRQQHENFGHYSPHHLHRAGIIEAVPADWTCNICNQFIQVPHGKRAASQKQHPGRIYCDLAFRKNWVFYNYVSWQTRKAFTVHARTRSEIVHNTKRALAFFNNEIITELRTDAEFDTKEMQYMCADKNIRIKPTGPYLPYQHGVIERFNRTQMLMAAKMHLYSQLPDDFFCYAVLEATNIYNGVKHSRTGNPPDPEWSTNPPPAPYGCLCYYKTLVGCEKKENHKARRGVYLGRSRDHGPTICRIVAWPEKNQRPQPSRIIYSGMVRWEPKLRWKDEYQNADHTPTSCPVITGSGDTRQYENVSGTASGEVSESPTPTGRYTTPGALPNVIMENTDMADTTDVLESGTTLTRTEDEIPKQLRAHNNPGPAWAAPPKPRPRPKYNDLLEPNNEGEVIHVVEEGQISTDDEWKQHPPLDIKVKPHQLPTNGRITQLKKLVKFDDMCPRPREAPPRNYKEWKQMPQSNLKAKIQYAMELELRTLTAKGVFGAVAKHQDNGFVLGKHGTRIQVVAAPGTHKKYRSKWEYVYKDTKVKARTCILGNTIPKPHGINTFAPTVKPESMRLINSYAARSRYELRSADITAAFVNARRHDLMFLAPIEGMDSLLGVDTGELLALLLIKSSYGTDDGPMLWNIDLDKKLQAMGFERSTFDPCTYSKSTIRLGIHVDDFKYTGECPELDAFEQDLAQEYEITFDGPLTGRRFLNQQYEVNDSGIFVHMADYIDELCIRYEIEDRKTKYTPSPSEHIGFPESGAKQDPAYADIPYRELTGALQHIATYLRLDIVEATNACSRFNHCYTSREWKYAIHILLYLRTTKFRGHWYPYTLQAELTAITAGIRGLTQHVYDRQLTYISSDASFSHGKQQDIMGYIAIYNGTPIAWKSKKVSAVHFAPNEAEYRGMAQAVSMGVWLIHQASWMGIIDEEHKIMLYNDNTGAIEAANRPAGGHKAMPHVSRYAAFAMSHAAKHFVIKYRQSNELRADLMTKNLPRRQHEKLCNMLLRERYAITIKQDDLQM